MKTKQVLIAVAVVAGAAIVLHYIINKKNSVGKLGPSGAPPPSPTAGSAGQSSPTGNQVYSSQAGLSIRSSPHINNGFFSMFGNEITSVDNAGTWIGTWTGQKAADSDGTINPQTQAPYNWYQVTLSPTYQSYGTSAGMYYVREDYINIR